MDGKKVFKLKIKDADNLASIVSILRKFDSSFSIGEIKRRINNDEFLMEYDTFKYDFIESIEGVDRGEKLTALIGDLEKAGATVSIYDEDELITKDMFNNLLERYKEISEEVDLISEIEAEEEHLERIEKFLDEAHVYYLATVDGDQPRVRPFGTILICDHKIYIQTGKVKKVSKQIHENPKAEICAFKGGEWLRLSGVLVEDERLEVKQIMLDKYPELQKMYKADDGNTEVFYFRDVVATIYSFASEPEVLELEYIQKMLDGELF